MDVTPTRILGLPLLGLGAIALASGLALSAYWPMALGLVAMAYGALRWTETW